MIWRRGAVFLSTILIPFPITAFQLPHRPFQALQAFKSLRNFSKMSSFSHLLIPPSEKGLAEAASLLNQGELVAFPTETVYGLGANALNEESVLNIFKAKGRPLTDPLIVHIATPSAAGELISISSPEEERSFNALTNAFWPGPLTIILKASAKIPPEVTAKTGFVGIRCPNHPLARLLIAKAKVPIAAPSANRFGHVSPTRAEHVLVDLGEKGVRVLDGESPLVSSLDYSEDPFFSTPPTSSSTASASSSSSSSSGSCQFGIESTVVKLDATRLTIFRQGAITQRQIEMVLAAKGIPLEVIAVSRTVKMHSSASENNNKQLSSPSPSEGGDGEVAPGQAVTHYAPDVPCYIIHSLQTTAPSSSSSSDNLREISLSWPQLLSQVVLIDYGGSYQHLREKVLAYRDLSPMKDSIEAARNLFDTLRWSEGIPHAQMVLITPVERMMDESLVINEEQRSLLMEGKMVDDMSLGVADRIFRAASGVSANIQIKDS